MKALAEKKFRAVIVGGGVTGLVAAHTFSKAGIDHVVLERGGEAAPPTGASIAIYPHGARILQQLGLLEQTQKIADPLEDGATNRWPDGSPIQWSDLWKFVREKCVQNLFESLFLKESANTGMKPWGRAYAVGTSRLSRSPLGESTR